MKRRRSCRGLLWGALAFVALQLALAVAVELSLFLRDPEDGARFALLRRCRPARAPFVLALGTSRTANGLRTDGPTIPGQPRLFNYGITGSDLPEQALRLRRLLAAGVRPQAVYLEILPAHLAQRSGRIEQRTERLGWSDLASARCLDLPAARLYRHWGRARALPCYSVRAVLLSRWLPWLLPEEMRQERYWQGLGPRGWRAYGRDVVSTDEYRRGLAYARRRYAPLLRDFRIRRVPDLAVRDMLAVCRDAQIPVVLYLMPEARAVREWYTAEGEAVLDGYLRELRRDHVVRVIDARGWLPDDAFADGHHLLPRGAAQFTERFRRELAAPGPATAKLR